MKVDDSYSIHLLEEEDAPALAALEAASFSTSWGEEKYRVLLRRPEDTLAPSPFLVLGVKKEDMLCAYVSLGLSYASGECEIYNIAVASSMRRAGLGRALVESAFALGREFGISRMLLEVRTGNTAARALYAACGFERCGVRKKYYADTGEDALVLERLL